MEQELITAKYSEQIHPLSSHFHDCYQLIYVVRGSACGFSDHSNFGRTFRKETGLSPSEFRKMLAHKHDPLRSELNQ